LLKCCLFTIMECRLVETD